MYPYIHIGHIQIPTYGTLIEIAFIIGVYLAMRRAPIYHIRKEHILFASLYAGIGLILGAKLLYALSVLPVVLKNQALFAADKVFLLKYMTEGFVFYGGLIGVCIAVWIYSRQTKTPLLPLGNLMIPVIPFIHSIGRIGCFSAGCCYGLVYDGPLYVLFPEDAIVSGVSGFPRFPVQLLESLLNMLLFLFLYYYSRKPRKDGRIIGIYLISYAFIRFLLEFLRGDSVRGIFFGLSVSQWISLMIIPVGIRIYMFKSGNRSITKKGEFTE